MYFGKINEKEIYFMCVQRIRFRYLDVMVHIYNFHSQKYIVR